MEQLYPENNEQVNPDAFYASSALLSTLSLIIADLDRSNEGIATAILNRLDEDITNTSETLPILTVEQEQKLNEYRQTFRAQVEQTMEELRALYALAEASNADEGKTVHPADAVAEGATGRAVLVLTASLSNALDQIARLSLAGAPMPPLKATFIVRLEEQLQNGIWEYGTGQPETDWLLGILSNLRH